jgi:hypothetical protein
MNNQQNNPTTPGHAETDLHATADTALNAILHAGARAVDLVEAWVKTGNAAAVATAAERGQGPARKAARRGLNVLKARGVAVPTERHVASMLVDKGEKLEEAFMLAPDSSGSVCIVITSRAKTSRTRSAFVFLHDDLGVHRVNVGELSQSQLKDTMAKALPNSDYRPVKIPVGWARGRIAAARERHKARGLPEPLGFASAQSLLEPIPEPADEHPFDSEGLELAEDDARELAQDSAALHRLPEFRGWFPDKAAVDEMLGKVGEGLTPGQDPDPEQVQKRLSEQVIAVTDRYFTPERREQLVRMMKDSALSVLSREGEVRALEVVATMRVIQEAGLITNPPSEIGFLRGFFDKAVAALAYQDGGRLRIPVSAATSHEAAEVAG